MGARSGHCGRPSAAAVRFRGCVGVRDGPHGSWAVAGASAILRELWGLSRFEETANVLTVEFDGSTFISHGETDSL